MNSSARACLVPRLGLVALLACFFGGHAASQDAAQGRILDSASAPVALQLPPPPPPQTPPPPPKGVKPTFGSVTLKAGFEPDPFQKELVAGGPIHTDRGGVKAWIAQAPDFQLNYTAGKYSLTFIALSDKDTTLLIKLPNGKWIADDDSAGDLNPLIHVPNPQSGRYDIWVGSFNKETPRAKLLITELVAKKK